MSDTSVAKVYLAINKVQLALCKEGISKASKNTQQGYMFRGIDAVYNALSPLLAEHYLCILPRMISRTAVERESKTGGALFYVTVEAEFDFVSSEDGSKHVVRTFGEAMDSGDKATNKAMSAAYKYACMQAFAIPTEGDNDADAKTHEVKGAHKPSDGTMDSLTADMKIVVQDIASDVSKMMASGDTAGALDWLEAANFDAEQKIACWSLLSAPYRSAIKRLQEERKAK